jgi:outer membrane immunogenic protein
LAGSNSETSVGWTGGGGFEFAVSDHVTLKGEYLFVDLGDTTVTARGVDPATTPDVFLRAKVENELHVIRAGLNVRLY